MYDQRGYMCQRGYMQITFSPARVAYQRLFVMKMMQISTMSKLDITTADVLLIQGCIHIK
jgi:hypothetical protein